ncbi:MAG TPA: nitroreductase family protein [Kofleriaceae bacterium]|nr:nitroreductase family protein [Kofleriaceae bacterium]
MSTGDAFFDQLSSRRSVREFTAEPVTRAQLERLLAAAVTAPSATNRQPWRFTVVTDAARREAVVGAVRRRTEEMKAVIAGSRHGAEFEGYGDFFFEPLASAPAIIVPQYRVYPDAIAHMIASAGDDPTRFTTPAAMPSEICATSAAVMLILAQAHADGLGACWMAGPTVARDELADLLDIREPWRMLGAIAVGRPAGDARPKPARKPLDRIAIFVDEENP